MTPPPLQPRPKKIGFFRLLLIAGMVVTLLLLVPLVALASCLRLGHTSALVREHLVQQSPDSWNKVVEFKVGAMPWKLARWGLSYAQMPQEARAALGAFRHAEFGIYERKASASPIDRATSAEMLKHTDEVMQRCGLERIVGVVQRSTFVAVYLPSDEDLGTTLQASVVVVEKDNLILASGRAVLDELVPLLTKKLPRNPVSRTN